MTVKLFALLLNYNNPADTVQAAKSLLRSADLPRNTEVIIIDNGPTDRQSYFAHHLPSSHYLKAKGNLGYSAGNNLGIRYALIHQATHLLIMNPDVRVPKVFFGPLFKSFTKHQQAGIVAPAHQEPGNPSFGLGGRINWRLCSFPHDNVAVLPTGDLQYDLLTFACVLIKAEVFKDVGLLDERYFLYLEDVDYCHSVRLAGYELWLNPTVCVTHRTSSSFADQRGKLRYSFQSAFIFIRKWYHFPHNLLPILHTLYFYPYTYLLWTLKLHKAKFLPKSYHRQYHG